MSNERSAVLGKSVHGAPDLAIEILSPSTRRTDEITKRRLYDRVDVREYWIVDPGIEVAKVYRRAGDGTFPRVAEHSREAGDALTTPLLPGFSLDLAELFGLSTARHVAHAGVGLPPFGLHQLDKRRVVAEGAERDVEVHVGPVPRQAL